MPPSVQTKPRPAEGILSGEQIRALGIVRRHRSKEEREALADLIDEHGLTKEDVDTLIRPTSIDLRIGRQYIDCQEAGVRVKTRGAGGGAVIKLPPLGAVIFSTLETIRTPKDVVGRFDLKISYAMQGLMLQVGPQIEPDYEGPLFGLLINFSEAEVLLADNVFLTAEFSLLPQGNQPRRTRPKTFVDLHDFLERVPDVTKSIRTTRLAAIHRAIEEHSEVVKHFHGEVTSFRSEANASKGQKLQLTAIVIAAVGLCLSVAISLASLAITAHRSVSGDRSTYTAAPTEEVTRSRMSDADVQIAPSASPPPRPARGDASPPDAPLSGDASSVETPPSTALPHPTEKAHDFPKEGGG